MNVTIFAMKCKAVMMFLIIMQTLLFFQETKAQTGSPQPNPGSTPNRISDVSWHNNREAIQFCASIDDKNIVDQNASSRALLFHDYSESYYWRLCAGLLTPSQIPSSVVIIMTHSKDRVLFSRVVSASRPNSIIESSGRLVVDLSDDGSGRNSRGFVIMNANGTFISTEPGTLTERIYSQIRPLLGRASPLFMHFSFQEMRVRMPIVNENDAMAAPTGGSLEGNLRWIGNVLEISSVSFLRPGRATTEFLFENGRWTPRGTVSWSIERHIVSCWGTSNNSVRWHDLALRISLRSDGRPQTISIDQDLQSQITAQRSAHGNYRNYQYIPRSAQIEQQALNYLRSVLDRCPVPLRYISAVTSGAHVFHAYTLALP